MTGFEKTRSTPRLDLVIITILQSVTDFLSKFELLTAVRLCTGSAAAYPCSPWEEPARGATRPVRGWRLSLPFIPSCLPTTARLSGTDIILSQWILKSTTGAVITMLIPPARASEPMQGHAGASSVHVATERN